MTTDRRLSSRPASPLPAIVDLRALASASPWWLVPSGMASLAVGWAWGEANWALAVYSLSFWHYFLYWLAYSYGAVPPREFRRDAVLWKSIALLALGSVYFAAPLNLLSLSVVAAGFLLNSLAAKALGAERTYYGYELVDLPPVKITAFPYSWIAHPMLVGNMAAYGGTLLNPEFRRQWWPLAVAHIVLNLGLLVMELAVAPQRRSVRGQSATTVPDRRSSRTGDYLKTAVVAICAGFLAWDWQSPHFLLDAVAAVTIAIYTLALHRRYTAGPAAPIESQESRRHAQILETIE
jgi:hypothetical protein